MTLFEYSQSGQPTCAAKCNDGVLAQPGFKCTLLSMFVVLDEV